MLVNQPPQQRLILVTSLAGNGDDFGDSLAGLNVNELPDGALVFVKANVRMYQLVKNLSPTVVPGSDVNVINAVGSSDANGRFCAVQQTTVVTLTAGTAVATGLYLPVANQHFFAVSLVTVGGTPGFVHAARTTDHSLTVTSASNTDTSTYLVVAVPQGE